MAKTINNNELLWNVLNDHFGHNVEIVKYENPIAGRTADICLEDIDTNEVILDAELYTLAARNETDYEKKYRDLIENLRKIGLFVSDEDDDLSDIVSLKVWTREDIAECLKNDNFLDLEENIDMVVDQIGEGLADCTDRDWQIIYNAINNCENRLKVFDESLV